jgi:uncharacterized protein (TIGR00290 family)
LSVRPKLWLSWSTGKDSAWALHVLRSRGDFEVTGLLTTATSAFDRVSMHGVRRELAQAQSNAAGVPMRWVELPYPCANAQYEAIMGGVVKQALAEGVTHVAFGDLFLSEVRAYRERMLAGSGLSPVFPLWEADTARLAREMTASGLRAVLVCVDPKQLSAAYAGRTFDDELLLELPCEVDPCGENGEFHTFCCAGPMFGQPIPVRSGISVERDGFVFSDLVLDAPGAACG